MAGEVYLRQRPLNRHILWHNEAHNSEYSIPLQCIGNFTAMYLKIDCSAPNFCSEKKGVLLEEDWSFPRKGLESSSERIDIKSTHDYHNVNIARYSGQEKNEAINDFSRLGYLTLTAGIVSTSQWALIAPNCPVVIAIYYLLLLIIDNQYHIITQNSGFEACQVNNCLLVKWTIIHYP